MGVSLSGALFTGNLWLCFSDHISLPLLSGNSLGDDLVPLPSLTQEESEHGSMKRPEFTPTGLEPRSPLARDPGIFILLHV